MKIDPDTTTPTGRLWAEMIAQSKSTKRHQSHTRGTMNKTEGQYAAHLSTLMLSGDVIGYYFERIRLILDVPEEGRSITLLPDFMVFHADGRVSFDEIKGGFIREDAKLKFSWACQQFPLFWWRMFQFEGGRFNLIKQRTVKE